MAGGSPPLSPASTVTFMRTGTAHNDEIELYWIEEGNEAHPAVVLVNGAGSTSVMWCREFIDPFLGTGHRVIRFDHRDVGRSTRVDYDAPYIISDLANDLLAVLDALDVDSAHLVGRSMGGMVNMSFAGAHPDRVTTSTLIYTSPAISDSAGYGLPRPGDAVLEELANAAFAPRPIDQAERVDRRFEETRFYSGTRYPFDERWARAEAEADVAHAPYAESSHMAAVAASPSLVPILATLTQPALVLHGTADPIIDIAHGRFLNDRLPNSTLIEYDGLGHEMPPSFCTEAVPPILDLISP